MLLEKLFENGITFDGTILKTTNSGETWLRQTSGTKLDLYCVTFTDINTGTVVGKSGTILSDN